MLPVSSEGILQLPAQGAHFIPIFSMAPLLSMLRACPSRQLAQLSKVNLWSVPRWRRVRGLELQQLVYCSPGSNFYMAFPEVFLFPALTFIKWPDFVSGPPLSSSPCFLRCAPSVNRLSVFPKLCCCHLLCLPLCPYEFTFYSHFEVPGGKKRTSLFNLPCLSMEESPIPSKMWFPTIFPCTSFPSHSQIYSDVHIFVQEVLSMYHV